MGLSCWKFVSFGRGENNKNKFFWAYLVATYQLLSKVLISGWSECEDRWPCKIYVAGWPKTCDKRVRSAFTFKSSSFSDEAFKKSLFHLLPPSPSTPSRWGPGQQSIFFFFSVLKKLFSPGLFQQSEDQSWPSHLPLLLHFGFWGMNIILPMIMISGIKWCMLLLPTPPPHL